MKKIIAKVVLFSIIVAGIFNLNAVETTVTDLKARAAERVGFWQAVVAGLNKTGYKADSEFVKRANSNLARAETHQQIVKSGKYLPAVAARSRKSTKPVSTKTTSKKTEAKKTDAKKVEAKKETKATKETKKETKAAKSKRQERVEKRKEARAKKAQEAKKAKASKVAETVKK